MADDDDAIWKEFRDTVNMTAAELEKWLDTDESKDVGQNRAASPQDTPAEDGS